MEWEGFEITRENDSLLIEDNGFSVGVNSKQDSDIKLLSSSKISSGEVIVGKEGLNPPGDFEPLNPGEIVDIFGVMIKGFEGNELSFWFKMGSTSFYYSSRPGDDKDMKWLESKVDVAFLKADEKSILEAVKIKPRTVVPYGGTETERDEFTAELEDRSFEVKNL